MSTDVSTTEKTDQTSTGSLSGKTPTRRRRGRPKGSGNPPTVENIVEPSRCPRCGSTRRGDYYGKTEQPFRGQHNGQPFTHIVRRRTKCLDCGQTRIDRMYESR